MSNQIQVLSNKEKAREKINVFHDTSSNWINLIKELIGNSIDVFDDGLFHNIFIEIVSNKEIIYQDDGCGIPLEGIASDGRPNYEAIFEVDFAGSRYGKEGATVGQNGVFFWTLAMTSENMEVEVGRPNGKTYKIAYHKGDRLYDLKEIGTTDKTYTKVTFSPDEEVWTNVNYTFDEIDYICEAQASQSNMKIILKEKDRVKEYQYEDGIRGYFSSKTLNKSFISDNIYITKTTSQLVEKLKKDFDIDIELVMRFSNDSNEDFKKDFLNTADLIKYRSIKDGVITGLKKAINKYLKDNNMYEKKEKQITDNDIEVGLNYVANIKSKYVEYVSQSKQATDAEYLKDALQREVNKFMGIYFIENPLEAKKIATQILINKRVREKADVSRANIKKKLMDKVDGISNKIQGLVDCREYGEDSELFIAEGLSALGSLVASRNAKNQACFPIRGKLLSTLKVDYDKIFANDLIMKIINCLGCGIEVKMKGNKNQVDFDINKLRYGKIMIATDADSDGESITCLLLTMFYRLTPTLIKEGRIYKVRTPLYEITYEDKTIVYAFSETEYDELMKGHNPKQCKIQRSKGLGEQDAEEMHTFAMNPDTRYIYKITVEDAEQMAEQFEKWMATEVEGRREYIEEHLHEYTEYID